ncbi:DeoR/GlpR family DNA-binding transcription regulator [Pseudalkalibacillus hwajinpoensis]|uniref:DeoR/GlpR family DNA-binding transcription regulator n=1 Tax=Guptibacillus hwajinpoensis TaxID=208199 RepID=UPI001CD58FE5|nr:DeoR/GlpR family DNA-binding transcription regulator [Pseudalkalibacillus hwajinpoensis]MCA0991342.1 DeoR/GlpR family DNA-binding transcription regulator [Pseudalkalibacillus hwajinpoensis]
MLSIDRYKRIIEQLEKNETVKVTELSDLLNVTEKTVRLDLEQLENRGILKRIHGGAILADVGERILPINERQSANSEVKQAIAKEAVEQVSAQDTILMDGGSTTLAVARMLGEFPVTVITNDIQIANELSSKEQIQLIIPGGTRIPNSSSLMSAHATQSLHTMRVNHLFFGSTGVSIDHGLTVFNSLFVDWKKELLKTADNSILVVNSSKFEKIALIQFADLSDVDVIITDSRLDKEIEKQLISRGIKVIKAKI